MLKKLVILMLVLTISLSIAIPLAIASTGFVKYNHITKTCIVGGSASSDDSMIQFGWDGNTYTAGCYNWEDPACCESICPTYNRETKHCELKSEILNSGGKESVVEPVEDEGVVEAVEYEGIDLRADFVTYSLLTLLLLAAVVAVDIVFRKSKKF